MTCDYTINIDNNNPNIKFKLFGTSTSLTDIGIDLSCAILNTPCNDRKCDEGGIISQRIALIAQNNAYFNTTFKNIYRENALGNNSNNHKLKAGGSFITVFPSYCENCSGFSKIKDPKFPKCNNDINLQKTLLDKKSYMFRNRNNNVISGPIINYGKTSVNSAVLFGGNTGSGLTRNQQLANMGRGLLPNGRKGLRFGVQSLQGISLYSNSNIYNNAPKGFYGKTVSTIPIVDRRFANTNSNSIYIPICSPPPPPPSSGYQFTSKQQLQLAVNLWFSDQTQAIAQYGDISTWDVSLIRDMSYLFNNSPANMIGDTTTGDITSWDVSNVTDMSAMFDGAQQFNQPISSWDVSNVQGMSGMFSAALQFNQLISNWDVSNVTTMYGMFFGAQQFNRDIHSWDVTNVQDMTWMFLNAQQFNRDISSWDTSNVTSMSAMFFGAQQFNQDISSWDVSNVQDMSGMFNQALSMDGQDWSSSSSGVNTWTTTLDGLSPIQVQNFYFDSNTGQGKSYVQGSQPLNAWPALYTPINLFLSKAQLQTAIQEWTSDRTTAEATYGPMANWDVSLIQDMSNLFNSSPIAEENWGDITTWDVSNVTTMYAMFDGAQQFNQPISSWDTTNVQDMSGMFSGALQFNQLISSWDVSNVTTMYAMFFGAQQFNQPISSWDVTNVQDMTWMFLNAQQFNQPISSWDTTNITSMSAMFFGAQQFNQDISSWDVTNVQDMSGMFAGALGMNGQIWIGSSANWINILNTISGSPGSVVSNFYYNSQTGNGKDYTYSESTTPSDAWPQLH